MGMGRRGFGKSSRTVKKPTTPRVVTVDVDIFAYDNSSLRGEHPWTITENASASECQTFVRHLFGMVKIADALSHSVLVVRSEDDSMLETTLLPDVIMVTAEAPHD